VEVIYCIIILHIVINIEQDFIAKVTFFKIGCWEWMLLGLTTKH